MKQSFKLLAAVSLIGLSAALPLTADTTGAMQFPQMEMEQRSISAPPGVSVEMLDILSTRTVPPTLPAPAADDIDGWLALQAAFNAPIDEMAVQAAKAKNVTFEVTEIAGVRSYVVTPETLNPRWADRVFVHVHGGAWVFGGGDSALREAIWMAEGLGVKVISVDYAKPPLHPFPAATNDGLTVWSEVTEDLDPAKVALFGTSAGGNIALSMALQLKDQGLPLPGAIFAGTPATDLANVSDTWETLRGLDPLGNRDPDGIVGAAFGQYIGDADPSLAYLSPVNGALEGFPPTVLISGTRDLLLSDTVRMHRALRAAGVEADLHIYDGQSHGDYLQSLVHPLPEADDAQREIYNFFDQHLE